MGNCFVLLGCDGGDGGDGKRSGRGRVEEMIKVVTSTGGVMELYAPITAGLVTNEFPGHRLFCGGRRLLPTDNLHVGLLYHLLPLSSKDGTASLTAAAATPYRMSVDHNGSHGNSSMSISSSSSGSGYYYNNNNNNRNSEARRRGGGGQTGWGAALKGQKGYNSDGGERSLSDPDVRPRYNGSGVWKVRLVINPEHLSEILSQEARTEELIESVRTVAKCGGGGGGGGGGSGSCSDSGSSSRKSTGRSGGGGGGGWSSWKGGGGVL